MSPVPNQKSLDNRCSKPPIDRSGYLCLSANLTAQPGGLQSDGAVLSQNDFNCTGLAQHALVLGPSQPVSTNSLISTSAVRSGDTTNGLPHRDLKNLNLLAWLLEPLSFKNRGSLAKWQEELRFLRDYQQEQSTNQMVQGQTRWTSGHPL